MATYYTSSAATGGGNGSLGSEWTLQEAADNAVAGDIVLIKADGVYNEATQIDFDTNAGSAAAGYIHFRGANADGTDDGTVATIRGTMGAGFSLFSHAAANASYLTFENLILDANNSADHALNMASNNSQTRTLYRNIRFTGATGHGVDNLGQYSFFRDCEFDNNGGAGLGSSSIGRGNSTMYLNCSFHNNTSHGAEKKGNPQSFILCLFHNNGGAGIFVDRYITMADLYLNNILYKNAGGGIVTNSTMVSSGNPVIINNVFDQNPVAGLSFFAVPSEGLTREFSDYNLFNGNASNRVNAEPGDNDLADNTSPAFTSEIAGSEDFTPAMNSPLVDAGMPIKTR